MPDPADLPRMYIVRFEAGPPEGGVPDSPEIQGALVVCFVKSDSFFAAIDQAAAAIHADGWTITEPESAELADPAELLNDEESSEYVREALDDGISVVYCCFDADGE